MSWTSPVANADVERRSLRAAGRRRSEQRRRRASARQSVRRSIGLMKVDGDAYACREACAKFAELLKDIRPRAVITHWPMDHHLDHLMAYAATMKAIQLARIEPEIYYHEQDHQTKGFQPAYWVDISSVEDEKERIIRLRTFQQGLRRGALGERTWTNRAWMGFRGASLPCVLSANTHRGRGWIACRLLGDNAILCRARCADGSRSVVCRMELCRVCRQATSAECDERRS